MVLPSGIEPESPASEASVLSVRLQEQGAIRGGGPGAEGAHPVFDVPSSQALSCPLFCSGAIQSPGPPDDEKQAGSIVLKNSLARPEGVSEFAARQTRRTTLSSNG